MTTKLLHAAAFVLIASLSMGVIGAHAETKAKPVANAQQRIQQIADAATLTREGLHPWYLLMSFSLNDIKGKHKEDGTIEEWWVSPLRYKVVVKSPSLNETLSLADADMPYSDRESYLVHRLLVAVVRPIPYYRTFEHLKAVELNQRFGKVTLSCIRIGADTDKRISADIWDGTEYCTQPGQDTVRAELASGHFADLRNSMGEFQGVQVALDNRLSYDGVMGISGHVEQLHTLAQEQVPPDAGQAGSSENVSGKLYPPRIIQRVSPIYPLGVRSVHPSGSVVLGGMVTKEGKMSSLFAIASSDNLFTEAAVDAVKKWTYEPGMRGGVPVDGAITIQINFSLYQPQTQ